MKHYSIILYLAFLMPLYLSAQQSLSFAEAVQRASDGKTVQAALAEARADGALVGTAFDPDFTEVSLSQITTDGGGPENGITISQDFDFPTLYIARHRALKANAEVADLRAEGTRQDYARAIAEAYIDALRANREVEILLQLDSAYTRMAFISAQRLEAGEISPLEDWAVNMAVSENKFELQSARINLVARMRMVSFLANTNDASLSENNDFKLSLPDLGQGNSVAIAQLKAEETFASNEVSVARMEFLPKFSVGATLQLLIKDFNPYNIERERFDKGNFMGFEVGVKIPLFFTATSGRLKAAKQMATAATMRREFAEAQGAVDISNAQDELYNSANVLNFYETEGLKRANEIATVSATAYELSEISYIEYLENLRTALEVRQRAADALARYNKAIITINYLNQNL